MIQNLLLIALIHSCSIFEFGQCDVNEKEIDRFVKIIDDGLKNANSYQLPTSANEYKPKNNGIIFGGIFDFIVIGAGASGSVVASRLSEVPSATTLLLEAGEVENDFVNIPAMYGYAVDSKYNWGYTRVPQTTFCLSFKDCKCPEPRGKGLGGSTLINGALYVRARKEDFDAIEALGNPGWNYSSVLPYFRKSERSLLPNHDPNDHGQNGPLDVMYLYSQSQRAQRMAFLNGNRELNISLVDYNTHSLGVSRTQSNLRRGRRLTMYKAYLEGVAYRDNLIICTGSYVTGIEIAPNNRIAYAVRYVRNGTQYVAYVRKEIILSAGSIGTPQILMLSGIGPRKHLKQMRIKVHKELSVGHNLKDHPMVIGLLWSTNATVEDKTLRDHVRDYLNGVGFYTMASNLQIIGFYESPRNKDKGHPDMELIFAPTPTLSQHANFNDEDRAAVEESIKGLTVFNIFVILTRPKSVGTVRLFSSDPFVYPRIDSKSFSDPGGEDIETVRSMIGFLKKLEKTESMKRINASMIYPNLPACRNFTFDSAEYWRCSIRRLSQNVYHPMGTCKMGPNPAKGAVVNSQFMVHGFENLRVVDASVFPEPFSGHPVANCAMIGEKAADIIKKRYKYE